MVDTVIHVESLGKSYVLGKKIEKPKGILGRTKNTLIGSFDWLIQQVKGPHPEQILWALKDVSFDVKKGEVLGIIGRNGAGKSTLLKLLSRITEPSEGFAEIRGRVGSLLEVGTGMHPELTGRENTYMNATLLGMTKREVDDRFDEIVDFSGIERFMDTPVKRYSSGMRVRLGFAIAAHLEPEILVVDEVLAVGDAEFQKKCLGKMKDVASHGRTVLFVSHNMDAILRLCSTAILLEDGRLVLNDDIKPVTDYYLRPLFDNEFGELIIDENWKGTRNHPGTFRIASMRIRDENNNISTSFRIHSAITFEADIENVDSNGFVFSFSVQNESGLILYHLRSQDSPLETTGHSGSFRIRATIPSLFLNTGKYEVNGWLGNHFNILEDRVECAVAFTVYSQGDTVERLQSIIHETGQWELS
jgi:lipopolysaccharide transport system ATP-binding protein